MKTLKFATCYIPSLLSGEKTSTWRPFDDKNLSLYDELEFWDSDNNELFGYGKIIELSEKKIYEIDLEDQKGHGELKTQEQIILDMQRYYGDKVSRDTTIKIIHFSFSKK